MIPDSFIIEVMSKSSIGLHSRRSEMRSDMKESACVNYKNDLCVVRKSVSKPALPMDPFVHQCFAVESNIIVDFNFDNIDLNTINASSLYRVS